MEGINPTLAFLALMFGLSGNAREDAANDPAANVDMERGAGGCPTLMIASNPPQPSSQQTWENWEAFWDSAGSASALPDVIEPKWVDPASSEIEASEVAGDRVPVMVDDGSDPIVRKNMLAAHSQRDPCAP